MDSTTIALIIFIVVNVTLFLGRSYFSQAILAFFRFGRLLNPPEKLKSKFAPLGLSNSFLNKSIHPSKADAELFLYWTGLINSIGASAFLLIYQICR